MSSSLINGSGRNHLEQPSGAALSSPASDGGNFDLKAALKLIYQASPRKQAVRSWRKVFDAAVQERMRSGTFTDLASAQKWLIGRARLYYEKNGAAHYHSDQSYVVAPKAFFENGTYLESTPRWEEPRTRFNSEWKAIEQRDEQRARELSESLPLTPEAMLPGGVGERIKLTRLSDVEARLVEWLWLLFIPLGMISMLSGDPATCKTFIALSLAAELSRGRLLDGRVVQPGNTLYLSSENPIAECIRPRFDALGGDGDRLVLLEGVCIPGEDGAEIQRAVTLADVDVLDEAISKTHAKFVVIDPIQSYLGAGVDVHRSNETRPIMDGLAKLAEKHGCAILLIRHLTKQNGGRALHRGLGSIDLSGAVRSELLAGSLPDDPNTRALIHIKSNLGPLGRSMSYAVDDDGRFSWKGESSITEAELLAAPDAQGDRKITEATRWLTELLQSGSREQKEISKLAEEAGISNATLRRAKAALRIKPYKAGSGPWMWGLPEDVHQDDHTKNMSTLITLDESEYFKTTSTSKKVIKDTQDAQKNCVSTLMNTYEKCAETTHANSGKNCTPDFKTADNHAIGSSGNGRSLIGCGRKRRRLL